MVAPRTGCFLFFFEALETADFRSRSKVLHGGPQNFSHHIQVHRRVCCFGRSLTYARLKGSLLSLLYGKPPELSPNAAAASDACSAGAHTVAALRSCVCVSPAGPRRSLHQGRSGYPVSHFPALTLYALPGWSS